MDSWKGCNGKAVLKSGRLPREAINGGSLLQCHVVLGKTLFLVHSVKQYGISN